MHSSTCDVLLNFRAGIYQGFGGLQNTICLNETPPGNGHNIIGRHLGSFLCNRVRKPCLLERENKTILEGAKRKGKPVSPLGRNGSRRYQKWPPSGSWPFLPFAPLCGTKGSSSGCSSRWYYWQSAECLHRECHTHGRTVSVLKRQTQLFGTPSEERWFPHKDRMLNQKGFWKFALC